MVICDKIKLVLSEASDLLFKNLLRQNIIQYLMHVHCCWCCSFSLFSLLFGISRYFLLKRYYLMSHHHFDSFFIFIKKKQNIMQGNHSLFYFSLSPIRVCCVHLSLNIYMRNAHINYILTGRNIGRLMR